MPHQTSTQNAPKRNLFPCFRNFLFRATLTRARVAASVVMLQVIGIIVT